jgi:hypothetical protein
LYSILGVSGYLGGRVQPSTHKRKVKRRRCKGFITVKLVLI